MTAIRKNTGFGKQTIQNKSKLARKNTSVRQILLQKLDSSFRGIFVRGFHDNLHLVVIVKPIWIGTNRQTSVFKPDKNIDIHYSELQLLYYRSVVEWIEHLLLKRWIRVRFPVGSNQRLKRRFTTSLLDVQQLKGEC